MKMTIENTNSFKQKLIEFNSVDLKPQDRIIKVTFDYQTHKKTIDFILGWW